GWQTVQFGSYEQDGNPANGQEPIDWIVLANDGQKALLLSLYALDVKPYNNVSDNITWSNSSLRSWLNNEFLNTAFTEAEKQMIPTSVVSNSGKNFFGVDGGKDTNDKVFLLNVNAANTYLTDINIRLCSATAYAEQNGARWDGDGYCWWWLRDPGNTRQFAAYVSLNGMINDGGNDVACNYICVRPAIWATLN
ncbi:MAG: serine/threonine protein kinase, partial [Clostridia bacterium]|nr:serine/threonine protein kinase [Clostridia bacterium]